MIQTRRDKLLYNILNSLRKSNNILEKTTTNYIQFPQAHDRIPEERRQKEPSMNKLIEELNNVK